MKNLMQTRAIAGLIDARPFQGQTTYWPGREYAEGERELLVFTTFIGEEEKLLEIEDEKFLLIGTALSHNQIGADPSIGEFLATSSLAMPVSDDLSEGRKTTLFFTAMMIVRPVDLDKLKNFIHEKQIAMSTKNNGNSQKPAA